jgi:hypothetical protein
MKDPKSLFPSALLGLLLIWLSGCSWLGLDSDPTYSDQDRDKLYKNGSVLSDQGGADLLNLGGDEKGPEASGIGVNGFLWRATLDTVSFMPIASADPFGGVILTDWYSAPDTPNERVRLNIFIRDRDLRADGIKVTVFRQVKDPISHAWTDAPVAAATGSSLENTILTKARQIRLSQKDFK